MSVDPAQAYQALVAMTLAEYGFVVADDGQSLRIDWDCDLNQTGISAEVLRIKLQPVRHLVMISECLIADPDDDILQLIAEVIRPQKLIISAGKWDRMTGSHFVKRIRKYLTRFESLSDVRLKKDNSSGSTEHDLSLFNNPDLGLLLIDHPYHVNPAKVEEPLPKQVTILFCRSDAVDAYLAYLDQRLALSSPKPTITIVIEADKGIADRVHEWCALRKLKFTYMW